MQSEDRAPTRVCCLCESWASGGIESFLCNVLTRMESTALNVDIVAASLGESVFTEALQDHGVNFIELSGSQHNIPENHRRFRKLLRARKYDVLHLNAFHGLSLAYLKIAQDEGVPIRIAHSHNTALRKSLTRPIKLAVHSWARERYTGDATALCACSGDAAAFLFSAGELDKRGFQFIPNGIDVERFRFDPAVRETVRHELGLDGKFVIGHVGRLCCQKNQGFLLDVLAEAVKKRPESVLLLVGEGEDRPVLEEKARRLGIADRVLFYGASEHVERLYWAMDVFVFPSRFEGFGIVMIEAQAAGLPVVCSDRVPEEARFLPSTSVLRLEDGAQKWAEQVLAVGGKLFDQAAEIQRAGFSITDVSQHIKDCYTAGH